MNTALELERLAAEQLALVQERGWYPAFESEGVDPYVLQALVDRYVAAAAESEETFSRVVEKAFWTAFFLGARFGRQRAERS